MSFRQRDISWTGHAVECRINAEHPFTFRPSPGRVKVFNISGGPGIRIDSAAHAEVTIPPYYDSLVAKIIAHGKSREEAISRMRRTLSMTVIEGIDTTVPLHLKILQDPDFLSGSFSTAFMDRFQAE